MAELKPYVSFIIADDAHGLTRKRNREENMVMSWDVFGLFTVTHRSARLRDRRTHRPKYPCHQLRETLSIDDGDC
jgi:hypothetical protein